MQDIVETLVDAVPTASRPLDHSELASRARTRSLGRRLAAAAVLVVVAVGGVIAALDRTGSAPDNDVVATEVDGAEQEPDTTEAPDDDVVDTETTGTTEPAPLDLATLREGFGTWTELATLDLGGISEVRSVEALDDGRLLVEADSVNDSGSWCEPVADCPDATGIFDPDTGEWRGLPPLPEGFGRSHDTAGGLISAGNRLLITTSSLTGPDRYAVLDIDTWTWTVAPELVDEPAIPRVLWTGETVVLAPLGQEVPDPEVVSLRTWTIGESGWRTAASAPDEIRVWDGFVLLVGDDVHYVSGDRVGAYDTVEDTWTSLPPLPAPAARNRPVGIVDGAYAVPIQIGSESAGAGSPAYVTLEGEQWVTHPLPDEGVSDVGVFGNKVVAGVGSFAIGLERRWYDVGAGWERGEDRLPEMIDGDAFISLTAGYQFQFEPGGKNLPADLAARLAEAQTVSYRTGVETWVTSSPAPFPGAETLGTGMVGDRVVLVVREGGTGTAFWLLDPTG